MKKKITFYTELSYVFGLLLLSFGTSLMEKANLGLSMIVAPAYIIHLAVSQLLPWFSFGMAEYCFQALLLLVTCIIVGKVKKGYLFSFVTAICYGALLDTFIKALGFLQPAENDFILRWALFALGLIFCTAGVSLFFHTYISPEAYEMIVKEVAGKWSLPIHRVKMAYDISSCVISVVMAFAFFGWGQFVGINIGTAVSAVLNGILINIMSRIFESIFEFKDGLRLRSFFEE